MELLLNFPTVVQVMIVVVVFGTIGAGGLYLVRRRVSLQELKENHDVLGFTFTVVGAFYGVVLAFVTVAAWQRFERASEREQSEALSLAGLYNIAAAYPDPARTKIEQGIRAYARDAVRNEWPAMGSHAYIRDVSDIKKIWDALLALNPATPGQQIVMAKGVDLMTQLDDARRARLAYANDDLPSVVWIVIYVGCVITIGFSYFFATRHFRSQALMCGTFSILIGLTILAITELSHPYQGAVNVQPRGFEMLLADMQLEPMTGGKGARNRSTMAANHAVLVPGSASPTGPKLALR